MNKLQIIEQEKNLIGLGGLSGILGGIIFILSMVVAFGFVPDDPATFSELVARFPDVQMFRVAENVLYLLGLVSGIPLVIALYMTLKNSRLAPALFGSALSIVGIIAMINFATPHVAHSSLSEIYQAPGSSPETQQTLGLIWKAVWGVTDSPLYVGFFVGMLGFVLLGVAMIGSQNFGKGLSWTGFVIAVIGFVAALLQLITPTSDIGALSFFAFVVFYFVLGAKLYRLSKSSEEQVD